MKRIKFSLHSIFTLGVILVFLFGIKHFSTQNSFCANQISCIKDLAGIYDQAASLAEFAGKTMSVPNEIAGLPPIPTILGNTTAEKRIEVNLATQRIYAYEGEKVVYEFPVSTGKWHRTPTGTFHIWVKLRYTRMSGGDSSLGTYYNLPNVPYVMFYYNSEVPKTQGFSIHGAYWHNNFGHTMSHGCINMRAEDVEKIYYWADPTANGNITYVDKDNPGTEVIVYGDPPQD